MICIFYILNQDVVKKLFVWAGFQQVEVERDHSRTGKDTAGYKKVWVETRECQ